MSSRYPVIDARPQAVPKARAVAPPPSEYFREPRAPVRKEAVVIHPPRRSRVARQPVRISPVNNFVNAVTGRDRKGYWTAVAATWAAIGVTGAVVLAGLHNSDRAEAPTSDLAPAAAHGHHHMHLTKGLDSYKLVVLPQQETAAEKLDNARQLVASSLSEDERKAKPYFDRIVANKDVMEKIDIAVRVYGVDRFSNMMVLSAETSGLASQFGTNADGSARTFMQITRGQFISLMGKYGPSYHADLARVYGKRFEAQGREMDFLLQFVQQNPGGIGYTLNAGAYADYYHKHHIRKVPPLEARIDKLWENVGPILQMRSNMDDGHSIERRLVNDMRNAHVDADWNTIQAELGSHILERGANFQGQGRFIKASELYVSGQGELPVVGNIMDLATAQRNFVAPKHIKGQPVVTAANETIEQEIDTQIRPWMHVYDGMKTLWVRREAEALVLRTDGALPQREQVTTQTRTRALDHSRT
ncbi:MAG TPA: hypothetical protein VFR09_02780 [Alphaproteobacteria bacterium]|nr:hypothetical protein [Alphaproteobacteria bacterium]